MERINHVLYFVMNKIRLNHLMISDHNKVTPIVVILTEEDDIMASYIQCYKRQLTPLKYKSSIRQGPRAISLVNVDGYFDLPSEVCVLNMGKCACLPPSRVQRFYCTP